MTADESIHPERRNRGRRLKSVVPLVFSYFNTSRLHMKNHGFTHDHNRFGACFEATQRYAPGAILFIRHDTGLPAGEVDADGAQDLAYQSMLAEVCWCSPVDQDNRASVYRIGVRYL